MRRIILTSLVTALILGCSGKSEQPEKQSQLTDRQRDSLTAHYHLPGAGALGKAHAVSDSAAARAAWLDSLTR
jgi:outer membrane biogenesis lipoprotein LolB